LFGPCISGIQLCHADSSGLFTPTHGSNVYLRERSSTCEYPHQESNLDLRFRKPLHYPLCYGGGGCRKPGRKPRGQVFGVPSGGQSIARAGRIRARRGCVVAVKARTGRAGARLCVFRIFSSSCGRWARWKSKGLDGNSNRLASSDESDWTRRKEAFIQSARSLSYAHSSSGASFLGLTFGRRSASPGHARRDVLRGERVGTADAHATDAGDGRRVRHSSRGRDGAGARAHPDGRPRPRWTADHRWCVAQRHAQAAGCVEASRCHATARIGGQARASDTDASRGVATAWRLDAHGDGEPSSRDGGAPRRNAPAGRRTQAIQERRPGLSRGSDRRFAPADLGQTACSGMRGARSGHLCSFVVTCRR
jgi:hypothetical protein